jgi:hypothetical protein
MPSTSPPSRTRRLGGLAAAAILAVFGVAAVVQGLDGRSTVHDALRQEQIVGLEYMTPAAIGRMAREAGLRDVDLPTCSVAGRRVDDGAGARCFAQYMRIDALMATRGSTYAQMPRFATADGRGTDDAAQAAQHDGRPVDNPARNVWVTETALSTALNTSYMAEQISLFGIAVGAAFFLVALWVAFTVGGLRVGSPAAIRRRGERPVAAERASA